MNWIKKMLVAAAAVAAAGALVAAFLPQPVQVETSAVTRGAFRQTIDEDGKTRVRARYTVSAPLAGKLRRITLKAGDPVREGMLLAVIVPNVPPLLDTRAERELSERLGATQAARLRAAAAVEHAAAAWEQAKTELERARKLAEKGFAAAARREQAELAVELNARELDAARFSDHAAGHEVAAARAALLRLRSEAQGGAAWEIRAPVSGRVLKVVQESEGAVATGAPLMEIADAANLEVVADVLTSDAVQIRPGAPALLERWGGDAALQGRVRLVEPGAFTKISALGVEEQRVNVVMDIVTPPGERQPLGDGYRIEARIVVFSRDDAVLAPVGALFRDGGQWAVFVVADGRAQKRTVEAPRRNGVAALIERGLAPGEQVIVYPGDAVEDGVRVKAR